MRLEPFKLERYLGEHEFTTPFPLSCSDCDGLSLSEVLAMADPEMQSLWENLTLGYTETPGLRRLREEIAHLYQGVTADDVLIAAPEELIFIAVNCLVHDGDHVICTFPGYQSLYQIAESLHGEVTRWEPDEAAGWRFDPDQLEAMIRPSTRLIVVNFPHNPTGSLPTRADYEAVIEIARRHGIHILSDEMYRYLEHDPVTRLPSAAELYERALSLSGMSKSFALAGARIGWLVTRDAHLYGRLSGFKDYTTICSSAPSEIVSLIVLRAREQIVARHLARIERNLGLFAGFLEKYQALLSCVQPRAGTICFPRLLPEGLSVTELCRVAREEAGVLLTPSTVFDYGDRHLRVGYGRENFPEALNRFDAFLASKRSSPA